MHFVVILAVVLVISCIYFYLFYHFISPGCEISSVMRLHSTCHHGAALTFFVHAWYLYTCSEPSYSFRDPSSPCYSLLWHLDFASGRTLGLGAIAVVRHRKNPHRRGCSSVGRVLASHTKGPGFDPRQCRCGYCVLLKRVMPRRSDGT